MTSTYTSDMDEISAAPPNVQASTSPDDQAVSPQPGRDETGTATASKDRARPHRLLSHLHYDVLEHIMKMVPMRTLVEFALTCKTIHREVIPCIYQRDATESNSSALFSAIDWGTRKPDRGCKDGGRAEYTFETAIANKANVNTMHRFGDLGRITTPLALAVHRSSYEWAEKLLQKGADPNIGCDFVANQLLSHLLGHYPEYDDARPSLNCVWRPLVLAVGMGDEPLVRLLVENGALDVVSEPKETSDGIPSSFPPAGDVTVHHIYATGPLAGVDTIEFLLRSFPESVNAAVDGWKTPLTMAISSRKFDAFEALLQAAAEVNYPDGPLVPPLHAAIETFWLSTEPASRSICVQFMHRLIQRGADVNRIYNGSSPLTAVLGGISCSETKQLLPSMFPIVQMLIQGQADVNYMDPSGKTPMCIIFDKATLTWDFRTCTFLQQPLSQLFAAGADVNKHGPNRETSLFSLLKAFFLDPAANVSAAFIQCTVAYGAVLGDDEANRMFIRWLDNAWFQKTYRMARYHGKRISKEILFQAYEGAIKQRDMKKLKALGAFGEPANTDVVLSLAFHPAYYNRQVIERSRGWRFDANFTDAEDSGRGYMHKIIRVLECNKGYREKQATRDLQQLLLRRCRPGLLDAGGKTALERLRMMASLPQSRGRFSNVEEFLRRRTDR